MKRYKRGFTLTEAVLTMGVVGVIAALLLPLANRFRPDPVKVKYLQTYDAVRYVASRLANDQLTFPSLYPNPDNPDDLYDVPDTPFWGRGEEFCNEFVAGVNAPNGTECALNDGNFVSNFMTTNGTRWTVTTESSTDLQTGQGRFLTTVETWLNGGNNGDNSQYFKFYILPDGSTTIADNRGNHYRNTRSSWRLTDGGWEAGEIETPSGDMDITEENPEKFEEEEPEPQPPERERAQFNWNARFEETITGIYIGRNRVEGFESTEYIPITPTYCETVADAFGVARSAIDSLDGYSISYGMPPSRDCISLYAGYEERDSNGQRIEYRGYDLGLETPNGIVHTLVGDGD